MFQLDLFLELGEHYGTFVSTLVAVFSAVAAILNSDWSFLASTLTTHL